MVGIFRLLRVWYRNLNHLIPNEISAGISLWKALIRDSSLTATDTKLYHMILQMQISAGSCIKTERSLIQLKINIRWWGWNHSLDYRSISTHQIFQTSILLLHDDDFLLIPRKRVSAEAHLPEASESHACRHSIQTNISLREPVNSCHGVDRSHDRQSAVQRSLMTWYYAFRH